MVTDSVLLPAILTVGGDNTSTTFSGILEGPGTLSLTKVGTGTLTLTGTNTYTGVTTIDAGVLSISQDANLGTAPGAPVDDQLTLNGGTLQVTASFTLNANRGVTLDAGGGTFDVIGGNVLTYDGVITGTGTLTKVGTGTLTLLGISTYTGGTSITAGTLQLGNGGATGSIVGDVTDDGILAFDRNNTLTFAGTISGAGGVTQIGTGTTILTGTNTYGGGTTITAGTLQLGNGGATGSIVGDVTDNGILAFDRNNTLTFAGTISGAGAVTQIGTGTTILTGTNTYGGGTTITAGTLQIGNGGTAGSIVGNVIDNGILVFDRSNALTFAGDVSGKGSVTQVGTGTTILAGDNTYSGQTTVSAGTLQAGSAAAFSPNSEFVVNSVLDPHGFSITIASLSGNGIVLNNGQTAAALTVGDDNASTSFTGVLEDGTGILQLIKSGAGTFVLTGANTYTGGTTINAGTLQIGNGGTLGSIAGNVLDNGTLAFDRRDSVTFRGNIRGSGNVSQIGLGITILTGTNTYSGGTTIQAGTLQIGNGGTSRKHYWKRFRQWDFSIRSKRLRDLSRGDQRHR